MKNPNAGEAVMHRSPQAIMAEIAALDAESAAAVERYVSWNRRFILFHQKQHPESMGSAHVEQFLHAVAREGGPQQEARDALAFLYREGTGTL